MHRLAECQAGKPIDDLQYCRSQLNIENALHITNIQCWYLWLEQDKLSPCAPSHVMYDAPRKWGMERCTR